MKKGIMVAGYVLESRVGEVINQSFQWVVTAIENNRELSVSEVIRYTCMVFVGVRLMKEVMRNFMFLPFPSIMCSTVLGEAVASK